MTTYTVTAVNHTYDQQLDTCGLRCPIPIMQTKLEISKLANGERLLVVTTDPSYNLDCRVFIKQTGHLLLESWHEGDKFYYLLQNNG